MYPLSLEPLSHLIPDPTPLSSSQSPEAEDLDRREENELEREGGDQGTRTWAKI